MTDSSVIKILVELQEQFGLLDVNRREALSYAIFAVKRNHHARWVDDRSLNQNYKLVRCTCCGKGFGKAVALSDYRYCPECGSRMDGDTHASC